MAIARKRYDVPIVNKDILVEEIQAPKDSTMTTSLRNGEDILGLIQYHEGYRWVADFYGQILNDETPINHVDVMGGALAQSYYRIKTLPIKLQGSLSYDYDTEKGISNLTGEGVFPPTIIPMTGDIFIGNVENGEDMLFVINEVTRLSVRSDSLYSVRFNSYMYTTGKQEYIDRIQKSVLETYNYDDSLSNGNKHILTTDAQANSIKELKAFRYSSIAYYMRSFVNNETGSIAIPGLNWNCYDPLLANFINDTTDRSLFGRYNSTTFTVYSVDYFKDSILENIRRRVIPHKHQENRYMGWMHSESFWRAADLGTVQYSLVDYVLHPLAPLREHLSKTTTHPAQNAHFNIFSDLNSGRSGQVTLEVKGPTGPVQKAVFHELFVNDSYIVSEAFYEYMETGQDGANLSLVEGLLARFIKGDNIDVTDISKITNTWKDWSPLEQFYYLPVFWVVIKIQLGLI